MFKQGNCVSRTTTIDIDPAAISMIYPQHRSRSSSLNVVPPIPRVTLALFSAGLATFALLYCVQPILPVLSHMSLAFRPPAAAFRSLFLPACWRLACSLPGRLSDAIGRKPVMVTALMLASVCTLLSTMMTSWHGILVMRALIGLSLSGVAAVGMTYLSEEIHPSFVAFYGALHQREPDWRMSGRLLSGVFTDFFNWRIALAVIDGFASA
jgi:YNFM family putative membrane transporter